MRADAGEFTPVAAWRDLVWAQQATIGLLLGCCQAATGADGQARCSATAAPSGLRRGGASPTTLHATRRTTYGHAGSGDPLRLAGGLGRRSAASEWDTNAPATCGVSAGIGAVENAPGGRRFHLAIYCVGAY